MPFFNLRPVGQNCSLVTFYISKPGAKVDFHPGEEDVGSLVLQASSWVQEKNLLLPGERMGAILMALWNNLHPSLATGFGLGQDDHGLKREGGFLKTWEDWQCKHFYFVLVFTWNSKVSRCQAAVCRLEGRALWKIHTKTNFVTWTEQLPLPPPSKCLSLNTFGTLSKIFGLMRNHTPKFQNWVIFRSSSPHFL